VTDSTETVEVRLAHANEDLLRIPDLEQAVWGNDDPISPSLLRVIADHGGGIWVAHPAGRPDDWMGFAMALPARDQAGWYLHSHMAAVLAPYRSRGIGARLKHAQRAWAAHNGYDRIGWTFDPFRPENAHFNLTVLGARVTAYLENYYPPMESALNRGRPTDRLLVMWDVAPESVTPPAAAPDGGWIEVPESLAAVDPARLPDIVNAVRRAFREALSAGKRVVGFSRKPVPHYQLSSAQ
jgi:predicted GNAT superfamily acetyltransferase